MVVLVVTIRVELSVLCSALITGMWKVLFPRWMPFGESPDVVVEVQATIFFLTNMSIKSKDGCESMSKMPVLLIHVYRTDNRGARWNNTNNLS